MSKFAVEGLSESLAAEAAPLGIKVTIVEPGFTRTEFLTGGRDVCRAWTAEQARQMIDGGPERLLARVAGLRQPRVAARRVSAFCAAGRSSVPQSNWLCVNASPQYASQSAVIRP